MPATKICTSPQITTLCYQKCSCPDAEMKTVTVSLPGQPAQVLNSFYCGRCHTHDSTILPLDERNSNGAIQITADFRAKADLARYVFLFANATVQFQKEDFVYEYTSGKDMTTVAEIILRNAMEEIAELWDIRISARDDSVFDLRHSLDSASSNNSLHSTDSNNVRNNNSSTASISSIKDAQTAQHTILAIQDLLHHANFTLRISDPAGFSRICPPNKMLKDLDPDNLAAFNTDNVTHKWTCGHTKY